MCPSLFIHSFSYIIINVLRILYFWEMLRYSVILLFIILIPLSCEREPSSVNLKLRFSADTIYFDTVFTTIGSTTRELRVRNPENTRIYIDHIYLSGGEESPFRLNIDGEPAFEKRDIDLGAGDSIFIFVDVIIDPTSADSPVAVTDSIIFVTGDNIQKVQLLAWGQDIILIKEKLIQSETWSGLKPYVIYDNVMVDTSETLVIEEGTRVLFHRNGSLTLAGNLVVNGSDGSPVIFAGDRPEKMYEDIPGQWKGICFLSISKGNYLNHAIIRNAINGIRMGEGGDVNEIPDLKLFSSNISHSAVSGLTAINGYIEAANCIFSHSGSYCVYIAAGGDYTFTHCTIYNRWDYGFRLSASLYVYEKPAVNGGRTSQLNFNLNNSVVYGDIISEVEIVPLVKGYTGNYYFDHCLLKLDTINSAFWDSDEFPGALINMNPVFIDVGTLDLRPDTLSPLIDNGNPAFLSIYPFDIRGVSRSQDGKPDIGAYERVPGEHKQD